MSVTGWVVLADWEELREQFRDDPDASKAFQFYEEYEQEEGWPARFDAERWNPADWNSSWKAACEASRQYDRLRKGLDAGTRGALDRILGASSGRAVPHLPTSPASDRAKASARSWVLERSRRWRASRSPSTRRHPRAIREAMPPGP